MVICLERGADLHMAQLMPLPLTVSCFSKIQMGLTFLVPAHLGSPGQRAVKRVCVCVARRLTVGGDVLDGHAGLNGHEAENREDDETAEHARRTVDERHDHSVSEH